MIDNKGTIKYLQSKNGITQITSTDGGHQTVTTFQLGGTLDNDTTITLNDGTTDHSFTIDGINFNLANTAVENGAAATADVGQPDGISATGYTLLVRDQATGQVKKMLFSDLIQSGRHTVIVGDGVAVVSGITTTTIANAGSYTPAFVATLDNVMVYRNGAKLTAVIDYSINTTTGEITLIPGATAPYDWSIMDADIIEYHFSK